MLDIFIMFTTVDMLHTFDMPNSIIVLNVIRMLNISMVTIVDMFDIITVIIDIFSSLYEPSTCGVVIQFANGPVVANGTEN